MARRVPVVLALLALLASSAGRKAVSSEADAVPYPEGFRRWAHVKSQLVAPDTPGVGRYGGLHHVYANALAMQGYETGTFPDGAVIAFDLLEARADKGVTDEGPRKFTDVMHKDSRRFASTGGWGFEEFVGAERTRALDAAKAAACFACHEKRAPQTFVISTLRDAAAAPASPAPAKGTYLVVYRPGPAWKTGRPLAEQDLREHGRYVLSLHLQGVLRMGGGFLDDSGGAMVVEAASQQEADAIVAADPAVTGKVMVGECRPWRLVDWEKRAKAAPAPTPQP